MGFNVTALAQKARTQTLIVDSDLDMGQYDVIATDVKGDTAEFSEFVGGVGNFESGLISGGLDVSGILHAEGNTQVDGNIILEGSINNVNIADDGEITTTKGVNGADFNGVPIKPNITVTPNNNHDTTDKAIETPILILPPLAGCKYNGTIRFYGSKASIGSIYASLTYRTNISGTETTYKATGEGYFSITLNNAKLFIISGMSYCDMCDFTLS